jgi:hypothetical protein
MILLTTPYSAISPTGFIPVPHATATSKSYDWVANSVSITYSFGTATSSAGINTAFAVAGRRCSMVVGLSGGEL